MASSKELKQQKAKQNEPYSYSQYIAKEGMETPRDTLEEGLAKVDTSARFKSSEYGAAAEALSKSGLYDDGYAEYLKQQLRDEINLGYANAQHDSKLAEYRAKNGYSRYIERYNAAQEKIRESVMARIKKDYIFDRDKAYQLAVSSGLSQENAEDTVSYGIATARQEAVRSVVDYAKERGYYAYTAKLYALNLGLDERSADMVYRAMKQNEYFEDINYKGLSPEAYIEILKERLESGEE